MTKTTSYCILIVLAGVVVALASSNPSVLSDKNDFLARFVGSDLLNTLGVILAITLASAAQLHLAFNAIEERVDKVVFRKSRDGIRQASSWLIGLFLASVVLVIVKPLISSKEWAAALCNGAAIEIVVWNILVLISITHGVFGIKPIPPKIP